MLEFSRKSLESHTQKRKNRGRSLFLPLLLVSSLTLFRNSSILLDFRENRSEQKGGDDNRKREENEEKGGRRMSMEQHGRFQCFWCRTVLPLPLANSIDLRSSEQQHALSASNKEAHQGKREATMTKASQPILFSTQVQTPISLSEHRQGEEPMVALAASLSLQFAGFSSGSI